MNHEIDVEATVILPVQRAHTQFRCSALQPEKNGTETASFVRPAHRLAPKGRSRRITLLTPWAGAAHTMDQLVGSRSPRRAVEGGHHGCSTECSSDGCRSRSRWLRGRL